MSASEPSTTIAVLAEKPSVARDIARELGASKRGDGFLHGNGYVVTWAVGHLVSLAQPHEINPDWKQWRFDSLPMLPASWPLVVYEKTKPQFEVVRKILNSPRVAKVVCATDAGREGELIFRYIYEAAACSKPVSRLWISSMTAEAIRKGFDHLQPGVNYDGLADAAHGRSRADWLVGMNLSRAYSLLYNENLSVGRVQTPTLAMIVEREQTLRAFVAEEYIEVLAKFEGIGERKKENYRGTWFRPRDEQEDKEAQAKLSRLPADGEEARQIVARAKSGEVAIESLRAATQHAPPPLLYDLTELQRHANRLYGFSAQDTLGYAQALYERHKLISYPRTDSRHLTTDIVATLDRVAAAVAPNYPKLVAEGTGKPSLGKRFVDDSKVSDHHALLPNAVPAGRVQLSDPERKIYDLICRRFLMMWHEDHVQAVTTVITAIINPGADAPIIDRYRTSGTLVQQMGWKVLDIVVEKKKKKSDDEEDDQLLPTDLKQGQPQHVASIEAKNKKTKPPKRFTEGTLLTAMQTAGQTLDEKELSDAMKETGLGTPATRAGIIETLLKRDYMVRKGKTLEATEKGIHLIEVVHPEVKTPAMTGQWEAFLKKIHEGEAQLAPFLSGIDEYVSEVVRKVRTEPRRSYVPQDKFRRTVTSDANEEVTSEKTGVAASEKKATKKPSKSAQLESLLKERFHFEKFLPGQKSACMSVLAGKDALLVRPSGSGKSLCYQLAGAALGGVTIIFSAHQDRLYVQINILREKNFTADCIHARRSREELRAACVEYLNGRLDFLFVAPERLAVAGFPEMLAKHKPALIAIEEADCIVPASESYSPDYALLGEHLSKLRPAPLLALSSTAIEPQQKEILARLGMSC
jgi:DNA topoisomerase III